MTSLDARFNNHTLLSPSKKLWTLCKTTRNNQASFNQTHLHLKGHQLEQALQEVLSSMATRFSRLGRIFCIQGFDLSKEPPLAPRGYIPVSVGLDDDKSKRFMIHVAWLADTKVMDLLYVSAEEFGFNHPGVLKIPCDAESFEQLLMLRKNTLQIGKIRRLVRLLCICL